MLSTFDSHSLTFRPNLLMALGTLVCILLGACSDPDSTQITENSMDSNVMMQMQGGQSPSNPNPNSSTEIEDMHSNGNQDSQDMHVSNPSQDMDVSPEQDGAMNISEDMRVVDPAQAPNLLSNPSFEDAEEGWGIWGGAARVDSNAYEGQWALRATNGNGAEQRVIGLTPNATYRLAGWGRNESNEPMLIGVKDYGGQQVTLTFTSTDYTYQELTFTMGGFNTEAVIFAYKHQDNQPGYADAISLTLDSEPTDPIEPNPNLELVWSDEFDGSGPLDATKWTFEEGFQRNEELQWYQEDNAFREEGFLVIEGRRENRPNPTYEAGSNDWRTRRPNIEYTSASVLTKDLFDWRYGRLEVRAKVTNYTGTWPAIWTLGVECEWPSSGEVDVMENYGGDILANFAWGTNQRWNARWDSTHYPVSQWDPNWTEDFHTWILDWTENQMTIRLDDVILNTIDLNTTTNGSANCAGQNPFRQNHYLLLNLALGGAGGSVDQLAFPTRYLVDYVRIYQ